MSDDDSFSFVGFMFDAERHKNIRQVVLKDNTVFQLLQIDDSPGHVQSGTDKITLC